MGGGVLKGSKEVTKVNVSPPSNWDFLELLEGASILGSQKWKFLRATWFSQACKRAAVLKLRFAQRRSGGGFWEGTWRGLRALNPCSAETDVSRSKKAILSSRALYVFYQNTIFANGVTLKIDISWYAKLHFGWNAFFADFANAKNPGIHWFVCSRKGAFLRSPRTEFSCHGVFEVSRPSDSVAAGETMAFPEPKMCLDLVTKNLEKSLLAYISSEIGSYPPSWRKAKNRKNHCPKAKIICEMQPRFWRELGLLVLQHVVPLFSWCRDSHSARFCVLHFARFCVLGRLVFPGVRIHFGHNTGLSWSPLKQKSCFKKKRTMRGLSRARDFSPFSERGFRVGQAAGWTPKTRGFNGFTVIIWLFF